MKLKIDRNLACLYVRVIYTHKYTRTHTYTQTNKQTHRYFTPHTYTGIIHRHIHWHTNMHGCMHCYILLRGNINQCGEELRSNRQSKKKKKEKNGPWKERLYFKSKALKD